MGLGSPGPLEHLWWRALTFEKPWLHCMTGFCSGKWRWMPVVTLSRVLCTTGHWLSMRDLHAMGYEHTIRCDTLIPVVVANVMLLLDAQARQ